MILQYNFTVNGQGTRTTVTFANALNYHQILRKLLCSHDSFTKALDDKKHTHQLARTQMTKKNTVRVRDLSNKHDHIKINK